MDKKDERFIKKVVNEAIENIHETFEQSRSTGTILCYKRKEYLRIIMFLSQINEKTRPHNVGVSVEDEHLKENEVRVFYIDTSKEKLQGG